MAEKPKALTPIAQARVAVLQEAIIRQAETDATIASVSARAQGMSEEDIKALLALSDLGIEQRGWSREELNIALKSLLPTSKVPFGLRMAHERYVTRVRVRDGADESVPAEAAVVVIPQPTTQALEAPEDEEEP
jgi:hypothetical protein